MRNLNEDTIIFQYSYLLQLNIYYTILKKMQRIWKNTLVQMSYNLFNKLQYLSKYDSSSSKFKWYLEIKDNFLIRLMKTALIHRN